MGKRTLGILTIVLISGLLAGWYFFTRESKYFSTSAFNAVPVNSPVIVRIHNLISFSGQASKSIIWKEYSKLPGISSLFEQINFADSLLSNNSEAKKNFKDKDMIVVAGLDEGKSSILYLLELSSLIEKKAVLGIINDYFTQKKASSVSQKSGDASLLIYYWSEGPSMVTFSVSFYKGICIASPDTGMVAKAIHQLDLPSLSENTEFQKVNKTAAPNADLNIYLNHKTLPAYTSPLFSDLFLKRFANSQHEVTWSEIDLTHKENELLFNGFTFAKDSVNDYLSLLLHQNPRQFELENYLPDETSFFLCLNLENPALFFKDYEEFLGKTGDLNIYKQGLNEVVTTYGINLQKIVADNLEGEVGIVFTQPNHANPAENRFFVMKTHSGSQIEASMQNLMKKTIPGQKSNLKDLVQVFNIDKETSYKIYQLPVVDFGEKVFGKIFAGVLTRYFTIYDNCLIMGGSFESLCDFLRSDLLQETMSNNQYYKDFVSGLSQRLSLYLWIAPGRSLPFFQHDIKEGKFKMVESQIESLRKIESVGWQLGAENGMIYNMARLKYNPVIRDKPTTVWRSHLDNIIKFKPQFVINQDDRENREVVVQDIDNNLYLINKEGRILWKIKLPGPILSEVFQINYFKDKKLQYLFNTGDAIQLIDRDGNYIENYPISFRAKATNGISIFDYENNSDWRFFVACDDHKVYAYDKKGKVVMGWTPVKSEHDVTNPIQYFRIAKKDYLVYFDKEKTYILDRKGKQRVTIKEEFTHSQNGFTLEPSSGKTPSRLVTTDQEGTVYFLGFDGSFKKFSPGKFSPRHFFLYEDLNRDGKYDFIYLDGDSLSVFDFAGKPIFKKKFKNPLNSPPQVYTFSGSSKKIGVVNPTENRVYLFNIDGSSYEGFPLDGNSQFSIGFFNRDSRRFNLVVGSSDGFLNNYLVK